MALSTQYDTTIKDIAGIKDYSMIFRVLEEYFSAPDSTESLIINGNIFDIRTENGRKKVTWAVKNTILSFVSKEHEELVGATFKHSQIPTQDKNFVLLTQR